MAEERYAGAERLGVAGLYIFALFAWLGTAGANLGLVLMLAGMAWDGRRVGPALLREPAFHLFALFTAYVAVRAAFAADEFPQMAQLQWDDAWGWLNLWFFLIAAWWLRGDPRRIGTTLVLALIGLIAGMAQHVDAAQLELLRHGKRVGFGHVPLASGLLSGTALVGLFLFMPRLLAGPRTSPRGWFRGVAWLVAVAALSGVWLMSQSRGAWLATVTGLAAIGLLVAMRWGVRTGSGAHPGRQAQDRSAQSAGRSVERAVVAPRHHGRLLAAVVAGLAVLGLVAGGSGVFQNRLAAEDKTVSRLLQGGVALDEIPFNSADGKRQSSMGRRIHMLYFGTQRFLERPLFGWGPGTQVLRLSGSGGFDSPIESRQARMLTIHPHVHNTYLAILVRLGLVGALLLAAGLALNLRALWRGYRQGAVAEDLFLFLVAAVGIFGLWCLINMRLVHVDIGFLSILLFGIAFSHRFLRAPAGGTGEAVH